MINKNQMVLKYFLINTPLGIMLAIASDKKLYMLKFVEVHHLENELTQFKNKTNAVIEPGRNAIIDNLKQELTLYFANSLKIFTTPLHMIGTLFQQDVWQMLMTIPYGQTISYSQQAQMINKPSAHRAVANANGKNNFAIIIPCHRIINSNGKLGGYNGGIARKEWLINHEKKNVL